MTGNDLRNIYVDDFKASDLAREALRQTERHLSEQQSILEAADRRSVGVIAILIALAGFLIGDLKTDGLTVSEVLAMFGFLTAIVFAGFSVRPVRFYGSGGSAANLKRYMPEELTGYALSGLAVRNDESIRRNDLVLKKSSRLLKMALATAFSSMVLLVLDVMGFGLYLDEVVSRMKRP